METKSYEALFSNFTRDKHLMWILYVRIIQLLVNSTAASERGWEWEGDVKKGEREKVINISSNSSLNKIAGTTSHTGRRAVIKSKKRCGDFFLLSLSQSKLNSYIDLNSRDLQMLLFSHKQLNSLHVHCSLHLVLHSVISTSLSLPVPLCPASSFHNISTLTISVFHFLLPLFWPLCLFFSFRSYPLVIPRIWLNLLRFLPHARRDATQLSSNEPSDPHQDALFYIVCRWIYMHFCFLNTI